MLTLKLVDRSLYLRQRTGPKRKCTVPGIRTVQLSNDVQRRLRLRNPQSFFGRLQCTHWKRH